MIRRWWMMVVGLLLVAIFCLSILATFYAMNLCYLSGCVLSALLLGKT